MISRGFPRAFSVSVLAVALVFVLPPVGKATAAVGPISPAQWPTGAAVSPKLEGFPNALRFFGEDRYQTSLATSLALRGEGGFPYDSPDPSSGLPNDLSVASGWWGASRCPRTVIVVSGDSPADALAATVLSDPTGNSTEPYLRRTAAADPLFDPIGGYKRVDTDFAPIIVTPSTRRGASRLSPASRFAIQDHRSGGCATAREAIIVGGPSAVPRPIDDELVSMGYDSVYRIAGDNRFDTASRVATSLGTSPIPKGVSGCTDGSVADGSARMTFYANSVVEWRSSASKCELLGRTAVLVDGLTGADAIAAGWFTAFWQVPVLLHGGQEELPSATAIALQSMHISNLLILGGEARISETVAEKARILSGAKLWRVAGHDRYETSVKMAEYFGGWWGTTSGADSSASMLCVAGSSGSGRNSLGWADALGAGAFCASASGAAANPGAPTRRLGPANGTAPFDTQPQQRPSRDAVPVILIRAGSDRLPPPVQDFLARVFNPNFYWCSSLSASIGCALPGFAIIFGGPAVVTNAAADHISTTLSGVIPTVGDQSRPQLGSLFVTQLSQSPIFREIGGGYVKLCLERGSYTDVRWLLSGSGDERVPATVVDVMSDAWYLNDGDLVSRTPGFGAPGCIGGSFLDGENLWIRGIGIDGYSSSTLSISSNETARVGLSDPIFASPPTGASGVDSIVDNPAAGKTTLEFRSVSPPVTAAFDGLQQDVDDSSIKVVITRGDLAVDTDLFEAQWRLEVANGWIEGIANGEAQLSAGTWKLRGAAEIVGGNATQLRISGGFTADIQTGLSGLQDDSIVWRFDAYGPG